MEKRFKNGLVLGKFFIPHTGHLFLIDSAVKECEKVYVIMCSLKREFVPGEIRYNWLKKIYEKNPNVEIIWCQDENPQYPNEANSVDEFYNVYWCPSVYSRVKILDAVFTSEDYGDEFARYLGVKHVLVDKERKNLPISGTKARSNPYEYWDFIPDIIKPYYTKKIVVVGSESTGKSTLVQKLADYYNVEHVEEYGRYYTEKIKIAKDLEVEDYYNIAKKHFEIVEECKSKTKNKMIFVDTEAMTTKLFGEMYIDGFKDERIEEFISKQHYDLYILLDTSVKWVDDETRDFFQYEDRKKHFNMIQRELEKNKVNYVVIHGDGNYDKRFELAKIHVNNLFKNETKN